MTAGLFTVSGIQALGFPDRSWDFANANAYLSMTDGNFGAFDLTTFALSFWVKTTANGVVMAQERAAAGNPAFKIEVGGGLALIVTTQDSSGNENTFTSTNASTSGTWVHWLVKLDPANGTGSNRILVWRNGSAETAASSSFAATSIADSAEPITIGVSRDTGGGLNDRMASGKLYQLGFFSGRLPAIGEVYSSGKKDISLLSNLYSYVHTNTPNILDDSKLTTNWTNNNSVALSADVP